MKRLTDAQLDFAVNSILPVRQVARKIGCSPSTVLRLRGKYAGVDLQQILKQTEQENRKLIFISSVYAEAFRLSRYPLEALVRTFETTRSPGSRQLREASLLSSDKIPIHRLRRSLRDTHNIQLYSTRKRKGKTDAAADKDAAAREVTNQPHRPPNVQRQRPESGTYAVNCVPVQWTNPKGNTCRADVLAVLERATGILIIRAYAKLSDSGITRTLMDAYILTKQKVFKYIFVGIPKNPVKGEAGITYRAAATGSLPVHLADLMKRKWKDDYEVEVEPPIGTPSGTHLVLPWAFRDYFHLNSILQEWAANYNCGYKKTSIRATALLSEPSPVDILYNYQGLESDLERVPKDELQSTIADYRRKPRRRSRTQRSTDDTSPE